MSSMPRSGALISKNEAPITDPSTRSGRNMPPGAPDAKLSIEYIYLTTSRISNPFSINSPPAIPSTRLLPPPSTLG